MESINNVRKSIVRGLVSLLIASTFVAVPTQAAVVAGGTVPLENYFIPFPNQSIQVMDVTVVSAAGRLASLYINNNALNGFILTTTLTNGGFLRHGLAPAAFTAGNGNAFTSVLYYGDGRTALATASKGFLVPAAANTGVWTGFAATNTGTYTVTGPQTQATVDFTIDIEAAWSAKTTLLAGFYSEKLVVSLVAVM
jgi:hypothetical protein